MTHASVAREAGDAALHTALQALLSETRHLRHIDSSSSSSSSLPDDDGHSAAIHVRRDAACRSGSGSDDSSSHGSQKKEPKRKRKDRVPTYYLRKSEKLSLELQLQLLNAQVASLKSEQQGRVTREQDEDALKAVNQKRKENEALRDAVQYQQLSFARVQSVFGASVTSQNNIPFGTFIHLDRDWNERHATLLAMKDEKMRSAQQYIAERSQFLDRSVAFAEGSRFVSPAGDLCALRFDVIPFEGIRSVKQVFDALLFYGLNMEISISEMLGDITIREDDGVDQKNGILQNRFVSKVRDDIHVETNTIMFCQLQDARKDFGGGREFAVLVADFVDEDELYPFEPATRLRHDVTAALTVTLEPCKTGNEVGEEREELMAVMTRTALLRLHRTDLPIPSHVMQELRVRLEGWGDAMVKTIRGILYPDLPLLPTIYAPPPKRLLEAS